MTTTVLMLSALLMNHRRVRLENLGLPLPSMVRSSTPGRMTTTGLAPVSTFHSGIFSFLTTSHTT